MQKHATNQMLPNLTSIVSQKYGMDSRICAVQAKTLEEARYHMKTQNGMADKSYTHNSEFPIYGTGQGSGSSPVLWITISSWLFDAHEKQSKGVSLETPDKKTKIPYSMIGFVDDSSSQVNNFSNTNQNNREHSIKETEGDFQRWMDMLRFTGGALNFNKCSYHITHYTFSATGRLYLQCHASINPINIQENNIKQEIQQLSPHTEAKTLGVMKCPSGNNKAWFNKLFKLSQNYSRIILLSACKHSESLNFLYLIYYPSLTHVFSTLHFSKQQLDTIGQSALHSILQKGGYYGTTPLVIRNGPSKYGGLGFRMLYCKQGIAQLQFFIKHWRTQGPVNTHLKIALVWLQLSSGVSYPIFLNT